MDPITARHGSRQARRVFWPCVLGVLGSGHGGCAPAGPVKSDQDAARPIALLVSGDTAGWIVPCGCTSNQSGGLPRRGSFARRLRGQRRLIVADAGGAAGGTSTYDRLKFEAILAGERLMGVAVHNLGGPEAALGADYLRDVRRRLDVPFVSANLRDCQGALVADPLRIVVAGGTRIALAGVVSPRLVRGELKADEPRDAILKALREARGEHEVVVVLAYLPEPELRQLAADLPEADMIIGGPTGQSLAPSRTGPTWLASATNKGKFVVLMEREAKAAAWSGRVVEMSPKIPDEAAQRRNLDAFHAELARRDLPAELTGFALSLPPGLPDDYQVAGSASCLRCHDAEAETWRASKHAHAWETLEPGGNRVDAQCQSCHTTGFGLPGGFRSAARSRERTEVGCESCHGPSRGHVLQPSRKTSYVARDQCLSCHDPENSPRFAFDAYWGQVRHGRSAAHPAGSRQELQP